MKEEILEYKLPKDAYVNFDALSLKEFIIENMNKGGKFTDQNYEGSNLSSVIDILSYFTHVLMFYLNQTSSESSFNQSDIYENMNKIVKIIGYTPTGKQTSLVTINGTSSDSLSSGSYKIKKYSYFLVDGIQYTINKDLLFEKVGNSEEDIEELKKFGVLHQGVVGEYPNYVAQGYDHESFPVVIYNSVDSDTRFISHGTISVYVKEQSSGVWFEYLEVDNLYLSNSSDRVWSSRLNENGNYEIKFGNNSFGRRLEEGDIVKVFYIFSNGERGIISANSLLNKKLFNFGNQTFDEIYQDVNTDDSIIISDTNRDFITFNNPEPSSNIAESETVQEIRENSPLFLSYQLRLVTELDYEKYIKKTIPNLITDCKIVNNRRFIEEYIDYFYKICVDPNKVNNVILNQANFSDSCDFNNINVFVVPKFTLNRDFEYPPFLNESFKRLILDLTNDKKMITVEVVPRDPVYISFDLGYTTSGSVTKNIYKNTQLIIYRDKKSIFSKETIKSKVNDVILNFFDPTNIKLNQHINLLELTSSIFKIDGVRDIKTYNTVDNSYFSGISFVAWNPMFENLDVDMITQSIFMPFYKFPILNRPKSLISSIIVSDE